MISSVDRVSSQPASERRDWALGNSIRKWFLLIVPLLGIALLTANPLATALSVLIAFMLPPLLWRPNEPPVLLFCLAIQWLQVTMVLHYANFARANLVAAYGSTDLQNAVLLGLVGLLVLALGIRVGVGRLIPEPAPIAEAEVNSAGGRELAILYAGAFFALFGFQYVAEHVPRLSQFLLMTTMLKWMLFFMLAFVCLHQRRHYAFLWTAVAVEMFLGFLGFFGGFKTVFLILFVALLATRQFWNARRVGLAILTGVILVVTSIVWSAIKQEYRDFLNQGTSEQVVLVPVSARVDKLQELLEGLTDEGFFQGVDLLIARVGYVTYFALTIGNVPDHLPHEHGRLWLEAVKHVTTPRIFFPGKGIIDDSERTSLYTGVHVAGAEEGTSISIGYAAESYVDFGPIGMFVPIFLLGVLYGWIYRLFVQRSRYKLFGYGAATAVLFFPAYNFESSNVKVLGGVLMASIITALFLWLGERLFASWIGLTPAPIKLGDQSVP